MNEQIDHILYSALEEELPTIDITSDNLLENQQLEAIIISRDSGVLSGVQIMKRVFEILDDEILVKIINYDSTYVEEGDIIAIISGNASSILKGQQLIQNILERMSTIATTTRKYVELVEGSYTKIIDSRHTTPNFRLLEKLAITHGGGLNYRSNLSEQVFITMVHVNLLGGVQHAYNKIISKIDHSIKVAIEVNSFEQFIEAIQTECDIIFLRGMNEDTIRKCISFNKDKFLGVTTSDFNIIKRLSNLGIDLIQVDNLTKLNNVFRIDININK